MLAKSGGGARACGYGGALAVGQRQVGLFRGMQPRVVEIIDSMSVGALSIPVECWWRLGGQSVNLHRVQLMPVWPVTVLDDACNCSD